MVLRNAFFRLRPPMVAGFPHGPGLFDAFMFHSPDHHLFFVHIPKCAGLSITAALAPFGGTYLKAGSLHEQQIGLNLLCAEPSDLNTVSDAGAAFEVVRTELAQ